MTVFWDQIKSLFGASRHRRINGLPDRQLMRNTYLPAVAAAGGNILFVGCRGYTSDYYPVLESRGGKVWTIDIDEKVERHGRKGRHRTGDVSEVDTIFADVTFDAIICNGVLGYGIDAPALQEKTLGALARIMKPGAPLLIGWNTDKIDDPSAAGFYETWFAPKDLGGQPSRVTFDEVTHVYDSLVRK